MDDEGLVTSSKDIQVIRADDTEAPAPKTSLNLKTLPTGQQPLYDS